MWLVQSCACVLVCGCVCGCVCDKRQTEEPAVLVLSWYPLTVPPACPRGRYGLQCRNTCGCQNGGLCDPVKGSCKCGLGWTGLRCDTGTTTRATDTTENSQKWTKLWAVHGNLKTTANNKTAGENLSESDGPQLNHAACTCGFFINTVFFSRRCETLCVCVCVCA